ncbi:MAG: error-prone DNA polymerase [Planctomycetaceae bacterium]|nr:error-prone DNA polymerase [Planctomycetaceae bacterium]
MYVELHCKSNFSFLEGASHADELVAQAKALGYAGLAITDRNSLAGIVRAHTAAKEHKLPLIIGAEITPDDAPPIVLWVTNRTAYGKLSRLITYGRRRAPKGECQLWLSDLADHSEGLIAGIIPGFPSSTAPSADFLRAANAYREIFGQRLYLLAELQRDADDQRRLNDLSRLARQLKIPLLAAGDVHYHTRARMPLHDVLTAIRHGTTVDAADDLLFSNGERHLKSLDCLREQFAATPDALRQSRDILHQCNFSLDELRYEYPEELAPAGLTPLQYLTQLTWEGASRRYPNGIPDKVRQLLHHEITLIGDLQYEAYFLTVWDLVRFARERGILCQGRGSAANSAVCFCLYITAVDPSQSDLLFERFISRERNEAPDIDVDFEHERREEVLQYLYQKYGRERTGLTAEVISYRSRSAIRDVGKALGLSLDRVDALAKQVETRSHDPDLELRCRQVGIDPTSNRGSKLLHLVSELIGFPRHLSQHVGGMVMTRGPLCEFVPIENAAMPNRTVISWDKNDLEDLGILKVDCLALGMLTAIRKMFQSIRQHYRKHLTLANIPADDSNVYDMICRADTMGVFQIESRAQMSMLPRLRPRCYYDLVVEVAIVRPGPIQGQMVHPYLRRRMGLEPIEYPNEEIKQVLHKTMGVPIFQEQAMKLAVVAAGFTPGEADQLRRAMGAWRQTGVIDVFRQKLLKGMLARGLSKTFAEQVFQQIRGFGEYGFPESHAASFALLVYVSAWLKHHYPAAFTAALINSQPMGFYSPSQLVRDVQAHDVTVLPIDVNYSDWDCRLERPNSDPSEAVAIRLGLRLVRGLSESHAQAVSVARGDTPFKSLHDFSKRTGLTRNVMLRLSQADCFSSLGQNRRNALWESLGQERTMRDLPLFRDLPAEEDSQIQLPSLDSVEDVFADYDSTGLSLKAHPISFYRKHLKQLHILPAEKISDCEHNQWVKVAGLVLLRQRPSTAKGITFVTLEDETGVMNLVLHQHIWQRFYSIARRSSAWIVRGRVETKHSVIHVVVDQIEDLAKQLADLRRHQDSFEVASRDFR